MCEVCTYKTYVKDYDPTRTLTLRKAMTRAFNKRFSRILKQIREAIITNDVLGLTSPTMNVATPMPNAFNFPRAAEKVNAFMNWIRQLLADELIQVTNMTQVGMSIDAAWTNMYIYNSYKRGVMRANIELRKAGYKVPVIDALNVDDMLMQPMHFDRIGVLFTRAFTQLKQITDIMDYQISTVLSQAIINGDGIYMVSEKLNKVITGMGNDLGITDSLGRYIPGQRRAEMIARTEIIRAHHMGTIQEYRNWAAEGVYVKAEWQTAGDGRVCEECMSLQGKVFSLDEVESMIPLHPNCRCLALPIEIKKE